MDGFIVRYTKESVFLVVEVFVLVFFVAFFPLFYAFVVELYGADEVH